MMINTSEIWKILENKIFCLSDNKKHSLRFCYWCMNYENLKCSFQKEI